MSHGIWLSKAPLSFFVVFVCFNQTCSGYFHPLTLLCQVWSHFIKSQENLCWVPGCALYMCRLIEPSPLPDEGRGYFPHTTAEMHRDGLLAHSCKAVALLLPAPSSPRQHSGYTDKPETTKPGASAESLAVPAVTLLRIPGDSRNHEGF